MAIAVRSRQDSIGPQIWRTDDRCRGKLAPRRSPLAWQWKFLPAFGSVASGSSNGGEEDGEQGKQVDDMNRMIE